MQKLTVNSADHKFYDPTLGIGILVAWLLAAGPPSAAAQPRTARTPTRSRARSTPPRAPSTGTSAEGPPRDTPAGDFQPRRTAAVADSTDATAGRPETGRSQPTGSDGGLEDKLRIPYVGEGWKGKELRLTLKKAVALARKENLELQAAKVSIKSAQMAVNAAWGGFGPHVSVTADFAFMGGDNAFSSSGGDSSTGFCEDPSDPECAQQLAEMMCGTADPTDSCVQFLMTSQGQNTALILGNTLGATMGGFGDIGKIFQANTFTPAITAVWPLFNAASIVGLKQAKLGKQMAHLQVEDKAQDISLRVRVAFYQILQYEELMRLSIETMRSTLAHWNQAKALKAAGEATRTDVLRWEAQLEQDRLNALKTALGITKIKMMLNNILGRPLKAPLKLVLPAELSGAVPAPKDIDVADVDRHPQIKLSEAATKSKHLEYRMAQSKFLPTVSLTAQYSWQRYIQYLDVVPDQWLGSWMVGINLTIPLFDSLIDYHTVKSKGYELSKSRLETRNVRRMLRQQLFSAKQDLLTARQQIVTARKQVKLAVAAHRSAENLYKAGAAKTIDMLDAQIQERQARGNLIKARYDYLIALVRLKRAAGKL
jgi:outer membrane protein TolC